MKIKVDDPVDAVPVHFGGGFWGILARPIFRKNSGIVYTFSEDAWKRFGMQLGGGLVIMAWVVSMSLPLLFILKRIGHLRVKRLVEEEGIDHHMHGEVGDVQSEATKRRALSDLLLDAKRRAVIM